jgi:hypothetical protein
MGRVWNSFPMTFYLSTLGKLLNLANLHFPYLYDKKRNAHAKIL